MRLKREVGVIIMLAQMGEGDPPRPFSTATPEQRRRFNVRQVSTAAANALFQVIGIETQIEHFRVIVALKVGGIALSEVPGERRRRPTEVGEDAEAAALAFHDEHDGVGRVVRRSKRMNANASEFERVAGLEPANVVQFSHPAACGVVRLASDMNGDSEKTVISAGAADVILVLVRKDQRLNGSDIAAVRCHALHRLSAADSGVE